MENLPADRIIVEQADHNMEIDSDSIRSIDILKEVTLATYKWLEKPSENRD